MLVLAVSLLSLVGRESLGLSLRLRGCSSTGVGLLSVGSAGFSSAVLTGECVVGAAVSAGGGTGDTWPGDGFSGATGDEAPLGAPLLPPERLWAKNVHEIL